MYAQGLQMQIFKSKPEKAFNYPKKKKVGIFRYTIDTKKEHFIYEEADSIINYEFIFFYKELMNLNRNIKAYHLETFTKDSGIIYFADEAIKSFEIFIKTNSIKILHAQFINDAILYGGFMKNLNIPFLVNFRGYELSFPLVRLILPKIFPRITKIIAKSNFQKNELIKHGCAASKIEVIYGGIDLKNIPFFQRIICAEDIKIISAARFTEKKDFETTIRFFSKVKKKYHSARLTLIGEGKDEVNIKNLIKKLGLGSSVNLLDFMEHKNFIKELYSHHIFVLPSKTAQDGGMEGIPNVLKEAMASGMPVISTCHAGIPELIQDGKTGFLVGEKEPVGILKKFEWILRNKRKISEICSNARIGVENKFDVVKTAQKIESLYGQVLRKL